MHPDPCFLALCVLCFGHLPRGSGHPRISIRLREFDMIRFGPLVFSGGAFLWQNGMLRARGFFLAQTACFRIEGKPLKDNLMNQKHATKQPLRGKFAECSPIRDHCLVSFVFPVPKGDSPNPFCELICTLFRENKTTSCGFPTWVPALSSSGSARLEHPEALWRPFNNFKLRQGYISSNTGLLIPSFKFSGKHKK